MAGMVGDWRGCPKIGGVEGGIGAEMARAAVVGGDGVAGWMAGDWRGRGQDWRGDGAAGQGGAVHGRSGGARAQRRGRRCLR
jgi:hypothetical protein